jgi:hypothetical protein
MKNFYLLFLLFFALQVQSQGETEAKENFIKLKQLLSKENSATKLQLKLDSLNLTSKDQRNNFVSNHLNRDIDFEFIHKRILAHFDLFEYQIDLVVKNDSIYLKSLKTEYFKKYKYQSLNKMQLLSYLEKRNEFYKSNKSSKQLIKEIVINENYAMYCGEVIQYTDEAVKVKKLAEAKKIKSLKKMLSNFSCEEQAYGIMGFSFLSENEIQIPNDCQRLIEHIKIRNSELQVCQGCIIGLVKKIF